MMELCRFCGMPLPGSGSCSCRHSIMATFEALRPDTSALEEAAKAARGYVTDILPTIDKSIVDAVKGLPDDYLSRVEIAKLGGSMPETRDLSQMAGLAAWDKTAGAQIRSALEAGEVAGSALARQAEDYSRLVDRTAGLYEAVQPLALDSFSRLMERELQTTKELFLRDSALAELAESANRRGADTWTLIQQAAESMPRISDVGWIRESLALDTIDGQMRALREVWDRDPRQALQSLDDLVGAIGDVATVLRSARITTLDGTLTVDGFEIHRGELEQFLVGEEGLRGISFEKLHELVGQQKDPQKRAWYAVVLRFLLKTVFLPFIIGIASSKVERAWSEGASQAKTAARTMRTAVEQRASQAVDKGVPRELLARYRIVTTGTLLIRAKPTRDSQRLGSLHVGDVVLLISTSKRSWALVDWSPDGDDVRVRGWVFARYLIKLRFPSSTAIKATENP